MKETSNDRKNDNSRILSILEEVKRKNLMDWGELEFAEGVLQKNNQNN